MRRKIVMLLMILLAYLIQSTVLNIVPVSFIRPNLLLMIVIIFAFMRGRKSGVVLGFICGFMVDVFTNHVLGFTSLVYLMIGFLCGFGYNIFFDEDVKVPVILVGAGEIVYRAAFYIFQYLRLNRIGPEAYIVYMVLPELVSTVVFTFLLYKFMFLIDKKLSEYELEEQQSPWLRK